jgi:hypothetical protein
MFAEWDESIVIAKYGITNSHCHIIAIVIAKRYGKVVIWMSATSGYLVYHLYCLGFRVNKKLPETFDFNGNLMIILSAQLAIYIYT